MLRSTIIVCLALVAPASVTAQSRALPHPRPKRHPVIGYRSPAWAPRGSLVAYVHLGTDFQTTIEVENTVTHRITELGSGDEPTWCGAGRLAVTRTTTDEQRSAIFVVRIDGRGEQRVSGNVNDAQAPVCSPDGSAVAYESFGPGGTTIFVTEIAEGTSRVLASASPVGQEAPAWSPDGKHIAFVRGAPDTQSSSVFVASADGSDAKRLTHAAHSYDSRPAWAPNGNRLVFTRLTPGDGRGRSYVRIADIRTGTSRRLTSAPGRSTDQLPAWRPTGDWIAFSRRRDGDWIALVRPDATGYHAVTPGFGGSWSADGKSLVFMRSMRKDARSTNSIWVMHLANGRTTVRRLDARQHWSPPPRAGGA